MSLTHELTDRVDWENQWQLQYTSPNEGDELMTHIVSSAFNYYLSNQLSLSLTAAVADDDVSDDWDQSIKMGITYRLK
jgi:hypothetical protein